MSALTWTEVAQGVSGTAVPDAVVRPRHLSLVPPIEVPRTAGALSLTARGRVVLTGLMLFVLTLVTTMLMSRQEPVGPSTVSRTGPVIVVSSGQTLSGIAAKELPTMSIADGVAAIQIANNLPSTQVSAGDRLIIPRP